MPTYPVLNLGGVEPCLLSGRSQDCLGSHRGGGQGLIVHSGRDECQMGKTIFVYIIIYSYIYMQATRIVYILVCNEAACQNHIHTYRL